MSLIKKTVEGTLTFLKWTLVSILIVAVIFIYYSPLYFVWIWGTQAESSHPDPIYPSTVVITTLAVITIIRFLFYIYFLIRSPIKSENLVKLFEKFAADSSFSEIEILEEDFDVFIGFIISFDLVLIIYSCMLLAPYVLEIEPRRILAAGIYILTDLLLAIAHIAKMAYRRRKEKKEAEKKQKDDERSCVISK